MSDFGELETLLVEVDEFAAYVTLNRPEAKNAMNYQMIAEITQVFQQLHGNRDIRAVVISGADGTFCAGGDIKEMRTSTVPEADSANNLDVMLRAVNQASQVVIAKVEGAALGGGLGLVCVSDVAIASTESLFGLPEVRLGIVPSFISPYVLQRIGLTRSRELMLTGRRFNGESAKAYGLIHEVTPSDELDATIQLEMDMIRQCAPGALAATKELIFTVFEQPTETTVAFRAQLLNTLRSGDEAQEGMTAFTEKRSPNWVKGSL